MAFRLRGRLTGNGLHLPGRKGRFWAAGGLAGACACGLLVAAGQVPDALIARAAPHQVEHVASAEAGLIVSLRVQAGAEVRKGQIVAVLDNDRQKHLLDVAKIKAEDLSAIKTAEAEVSFRQAALDEMRYKERRRLAMDYQVRQAEAQLKIAQARLETAHKNKKLAELDLANARQNLERRTLRSPLNGVVVKVAKTSGEMVSAGTAVATVADPSRLRLDLSLSEKAAAALKVGQIVPLQTADGRSLLGEIASILPGQDGARVVQVVAENPASANTLPTEPIQASLPPAAASPPSASPPVAQADAPPPPPAGR